MQATVYTLAILCGAKRSQRTWAPGPTSGHVLFVSHARRSVWTSSCVMWAAGPRQPRPQALASSTRQSSRHWSPRRSLVAPWRRALADRRRFLATRLSRATGSWTLQLAVVVDASWIDYLKL